MNAAVEVPTASMGFEPRSTSSMYTPGDRYDVAIELLLYRSVVGDRTREAASRGRLPLLPLRDDHMTNDLTLHTSKESPLRCSHDLRWLRLQPQLLGAHPTWGCSELIEDLAVTLPHALAP